MSAYQDFRNKDWNIDFMARRHVMSAISVVAVLFSVFTMATKGFNFGLDFTGGTLIEVRYQESANLEKIREQLAQAGYSHASVVSFGTANDVLVRLQQDNDPLLGDKIMDVLHQGGTQVEKRRVDYVGPQVGEDLRDQFQLFYQR